MGNESTWGLVPEVERSEKRSQGQRKELGAGGDESGLWCEIEDDKVKGRWNFP